MTWSGLREWLPAGYLRNISSHLRTLLSSFIIFLRYVGHSSYSFKTLGPVGTRVLGALCLPLQPVGPSFCTTFSLSLFCQLNLKCG